VVSLTYDELNLQPDSYHCRYDRLELHDVDPSNERSRFDKACTDEYAAGLTEVSPGNVVLVDFRSDASINEGRFALRWTFEGSFITSGNFPTKNTMIEPWFNHVFGYRFTTWFNHMVTRGKTMVRPLIMVDRMVEPWYKNHGSNMVFIPWFNHTGNNAR